MNTQENNQTHQFFHNSINITEWMKTKITNFLTDKKFTILLMDINSETMTRMSKITILNNIKLKFKDQNENVFALNNYSSISKEYDEGEELNWLVDYIKELEIEAILKFGSSTLQTKETSDYIPKNVNISNVQEKKLEDISFDIYMNTSVNDIVAFLSKKEFIQRWTFNGKIEGNNVLFENVILQNIKASKDSVDMEFKWIDWNEFSQVKILAIQAGDCVKISLKQKGVPIAFVDNVKEQWNSRIFAVISKIFNCAIKPTY